MADISQGNHANLILAPGEVYRIVTGGVATVLAVYGAPAGTTTVTAASQAFGPYDAPAKLKVTATSGTCSYAIDQVDALGANRASGALTPASSAALAASGFAGSKSNGIVALYHGDSLVGNGFNSGGGTTAQNPLALADAKLGGVLKRIVNGGVSGERSSQRLAALPALLAATVFDLVVLGPMSVNDIDASKGTILTSYETIANYDAMLALCFAAGVKQVWFSTVHRPSTTTVGALTAAGNVTRKWYDALDTYMRGKARSDSRIKVAEYCRAACNGAGTALRTNYNLLSSDLTHIGYLGADSIAAAYTPLLQQLPFTPWDISRLNGNYRNLLGPGASSLQGSFSAGTGNVLFNTGITGTDCPGGISVRRQSGDSTFTGANVASIASPVGLDGRSVTMDYTIGAGGGGGGFLFGLKNYTDARANSTAYTLGHRISIGSTTLTAQCYTPGTSAASAPDFSASQAGDLVTDGTAVWQITEIPQVGDLVLVEVDMSITANTGGASPWAWVQFIGTSNETLAGYLNYAGNASAVAWPTTTGRFLLRAVMPVPALSSGAVKTINVMPGVQGANASTGTVQVHGVSVTKYS